MLGRSGGQGGEGGKTILCLKASDSVILNNIVFLGVYVWLANSLNRGCKGRVSER